jgi:MoaA/NifB/PqqE/SkfB family radical SAM enzyme
VFCPNNALSRDKQHMDDSLFDDIIEQCRSFPLEAIEPFLQGEPFCDPKIMDRLEKISSRLPKTKLRLYSNGYALSPARIDQLINFGIDHLYISVNTLDPARYEAVMGLKLDRTLSNLAYLTDPVRRSRVARNITFRMIRTEDTSLEEQESFLDYCKTRGVKSFIVALFNYKGDINSSLPVPGYPCEHIDRLDILANGKVTLCCMDQNAAYGWGDVHEQSLLDIYRGKVANKYRQAHRSGNRRSIEPCAQCNLFWPSLKGMSPLRTAKFAAEAGLYFLKHKPSGVKAPTKPRTSLPVIP